MVDTARTDATMWRWRVASVSETGIYKTTDFADSSDYYLAVYYCHLWMNLGNPRNPWLKWEKAVADTAKTYACVAIRLLLICLLTLYGDTSADGNGKSFGGCRPKQVCARLA